MAMKHLRCGEWPHDLFDEVETAFEDALRGGDEKLAESLKLFGAAAAHPQPELLMNAWRGLHGDADAMYAVAKVFQGKRPWWSGGRKLVRPDLALYWLERAVAKILSRQECPHILPDDVIAAIEEFVANPYWRNIFLRAPQGARCRLSMCFYFSENRTGPDFPLTEYRSLRKIVEDSLTSDDLMFLIENEDDNPNKVHHFREILEQRKDK